MDLVGRHMTVETTYKTFAVYVNKVYILFIHYYAALFQGAASDFPHHESAAELR